MALEPRPTPPPIEGTEGYRLRLPRQGEIMGIVEQLLGGNRIRVKCVDGKTRMGRIPGRIKKKVWIKTGDLVLIVPWSFQDEKAEVAFRYTRQQVEALRRQGIWKG
ncbi:MAG: translation initiation factor eIF-1A [Euryarchaeota archaeon]|nr:translation initiation factor eIF-1A [Euryarchaeota archaeon]